MTISKKKTVPASVSIEDLNGLDEAIENINKLNKKKFINRSQIIDVSLTLDGVKDAIKNARHLKDKEKKATTISLSQDRIELLDSIGEIFGTTRSLMLDIAIRHILEVVHNIESCCEDFIVGNRGSEYLVPVSRLHSTPDIGTDLVQSILGYGEVIEHYQDGEYVLVPYEVLFNGFLLGSRQCSR